MRAITRTIPVTKILCAQVTLEGTAPKLEALEPVVICGSHVPEEKCLAKVRTEYGHRAAFVVTDVKYFELHYRMPLEEFMLRAELVKEGGTEEAKLDRQE